jgi:hypothetical protein
MVEKLLLRVAIVLYFLASETGIWTGLDNKIGLKNNIFESI